MPPVIGGQRQLDAAGELAFPHADAQQILQVGLCQGERQPLLLEGAVQGEGANPRVPSKSSVVWLSKVVPRVRGLPWPGWLPRGPRASVRPESSRSRGLPLLDSVSLSRPWSMRVCLRAQRQGRLAWLGV